MFCEFDEDDLLIEEDRDEQDAEEDEDLIALIKESKRSMANSLMSEEDGVSGGGNTPLLPINQSLNAVLEQSERKDSTASNQSDRDSGGSVSFDYVHDKIKQRSNKNVTSNRLTSVKRRAMSFGVSHNLKELDSATAVNIIQLVSTRLLLQHDMFYDAASLEDVPKASAVNQYLEQQLNYKCMEILFKLSICSSETVFKCLVSDALATSLANNCLDVPFNSNLDADKLPFVSSLSHFKLIEYMNWDLPLLERLLLAVNENMKGFAKYMEVLSPPLRLAIWNFLTNSNEEYVKSVVKQPHTSALVNTARDTFDALYKQMSKKHRSKVWPTLACLCIITADDLTKCIRAGTKKFGGSENMTNFIHKDIIKQFDDKDKSAVLPPLMELYRASTYVSSEDCADSGFFYIVEQFQDKLLNIFCPEVTGKKDSKPYSTDELNELELWTFFIVTFYRRNPEKCKRTFSQIMHDGTIEQKQALSKALLFLISDRSSYFDYNRHLESDYKQLAQTVRDFFKETFDQFNGKEKDNDDSPTLSSGQSFRTPKKGLASFFREKVGGNKSSDVSSPSGGSGTAPNFKLFDTINTLLHVFSADPAFFLTKTVGDDKSHYNDRNFTMLADFFVVNTDPIIQDQITRLFQKLFLEHNIKNWSDELFIGFCNISTDVLQRLSQALFELNEIDQLQATKSLLNLLRNITYRAKKFYINNREPVLMLDQIVNGQKRLQALEILASNLLVCLCSTDKEIWQSTTRCLRDVCDQIEVLNNQDLKYLNYNFYRQLSGVDLNGKIYSERKYQIQLFRRVEYQTKSNLAAFNEVYRRWKDLLDQLSTEDNVSTTNNTWKDLFSNYTSLLCALGGVCIQQSQDKSTSTKNVLQSTGLKKDENNSVDSYIGDLMKQVISDDPNVRQMVTIAISTDLSPTLYTKLFLNMKLSIQEQMGQNFNVTPKNNLLVDQYLHIVKTIVESPEATTDLSLAQDIDSITELFSNYSTHGEYDNKDILDIKLQLCAFIESLMGKAEYLTFKNTEEQKLRRTILQHVMEWTSDFIFKEGKNNRSSSAIPVITPRNGSEVPLIETNTQISTEIKKTYSDLDLVCLKAFGSLLNGLTISNDEFGREEYSKYFSFLLRFLKKTKEGPLAASIYKAFSQLLQTNVSFGLEYYMSKVYDNNNIIRSTFLSLLSELIKKGLLVEEEEKDKPKAAISKYQDFIHKMIFTNRKRALFALFEQCKNPEKDDLCEAVIRVYQNKGSIEKNLLDLFRQSVIHEVAATPKAQPETLFRANSTASKLMKKYCLRVSNPYLTTVIGGFIDTMCSRPAKFEIDPVKAQQRGENVDDNIQNVTEVLQEFIDCLCESTGQTPYPFRMYCRYLYEEVGKKFSKSDDDEQFDFKYIAVGGFLILRLICPAITSPNLYGLCGDDISADSRRYAIILTKLVQNLANGIADAKKEEFMRSFVDVIKNNIKKIQTFFENIAAPISDVEECVKIEETVTEEELKEAYTVLYRFFFNYSDSLREELSQLSEEDPEDELKEVLEEVNVAEEQKKSNKTLQNGKTLCDVLDQALELFGKPPEEQKAGRRLSIKKRAKDENEFSNTLFEELMRKNDNRDVSKLSEMKFFSISEHKNTKGQRMVYFIPYFLDLSRFPFELVLYFILKNMETIWKEPFVIVVDCTYWTKKFDIRLSAFMTLSKHIPQGAKKNLQEIYLVNPNNFFNKSTKILVSHLRNMRWKVVSSKSFVGTEDENDSKSSNQSSAKNVKDPLELAQPKHNLLPAMTQNIYTKSEIVFRELQLVFSSHVKDCEIRMFDQYMFVVVKDQKFINNKIDFDSLEHIPIGKIANISLKKTLFGKSGKATKDFIVKYIDDEDAEASFNFRTQTIEERDQIMQAIRNYVERKSRGAKTREVERDYKRLKPQDVPGQLLAISFFNMDSKNSQIRTSSYTLLTSIFEQLKLPKTVPLVLESDVVCVPRNNETTVLKTSEFVARSKPELTLEFLSEALSAFKTISGSKSKLKCASFILPWLDNLSRFDIGDEADEKTESIRNWFETFAKLCCENEDIYPALQIVWKHLCKLNPSLVRLAVDAVLKHGTSPDMLLNGEQALIGDILETIVVNSPVHLNIAQVLLNKIIEPIMTEELNMDVLCKATIKDLVKSKDIIGKIPVYLSYVLMLSFHSQLNLLENLPYILFIISMFLGVGSDTYIRSITYGICCNCVHALVLEIPPAEQFETIRAKLVKLHLKMIEKDAKSAFMGGDFDPTPFASSSDYVTKVSTGKTVFEPTTMYKYEEIMTYLKEVMECFDYSFDTLNQHRSKLSKQVFTPATPKVTTTVEEGSDNTKDTNNMDDDCTENDMTEGDIDDEHGNTISTISAIPSTSTSDIVKSSSDNIKNVWLKIYTNLCKDTMKTANILLFPKSLIAYSIVSLQEQSYDMIPFVLNFIGKRGIDTLADNELMLSVVLSITQFCNNMVMEKEKTETIQKLVLFGFLLLSVGNTKIYYAVIRMLGTAFNVLYESQDIHDGYTSLGDYFQTVYKSDFSKYALFIKEFEETIGISFGEHFSFALSVLLMKGLAVDDSTIRKATISFVKQLIHMCNKLKFEPQKQLGFVTALIPFDKQFNSVLYSEQLFVESMFTKETVFLFQKYLFTISASGIDLDSCASVYKTLARGFEALPDTFSDVFQDHTSMSQVIKVYTSSQDDSIIEHSLNLFKIMSNNAKSKKLQVKEPFAEYGFKGFRDQITFQNTKDDLKKKCQKTIITFLLENFNEKEYPSMDSVIISKTGLKRPLIKNQPIQRQGSSNGALTIKK